MKLSYTPIRDDSRAVAVARETGGSSRYRIAYITPPSEQSFSDAAGSTARAYLTSSGHSSNTSQQTGFDGFDAEGSTKLTLPASFGFEPLPPIALESEDKQPREIWLVTGPSGSGKSHWIRMYAKNYHKVFPSNGVYLISSLQKDDTLDAIDFLKRIDVSKLVANPPKDVTTWKDSLVIIDDVEGLDSKQGEAVQRVQDMIASEGRHKSTSLIRASHLSTDYRKTRLLLQEVHGFVLFPQSGAHSQYTYLLTKYGGMEKKAVSALLGVQTRWLCVHHTSPRYFMTSSSLSIL